MTQALAAYGIHFDRNGTEVPELTDLSDVGGSLRLAEVTAHDGAGWAERIATILDGGTVRATFNLVPANAQHTGLRTDMTGKTLQSFGVDMPGGSPTWTFSAYVTNYRIGTTPVDGVLPLTVELTISGAVTFA